MLTFLLRIGFLSHSKCVYVLSQLDSPSSQRNLSAAVLQVSFMREEETSPVPRPTPYCLCISNTDLLLITTLVRHWGLWYPHLGTTRATANLVGRDNVGGGRGGVILAGVWGWVGWCRREQGAEGRLGSRLSRLCPFPSSGCGITPSGVPAAANQTPLPIPHPLQTQRFALRRGVCSDCLSCGGVGSAPAAEPLPGGSKAQQSPGLRNAQGFCHVPAGHQLVGCLRSTWDESLLCSLPP